MCCLSPVVRQVERGRPRSSGCLPVSGESRRAFGCKSDSWRHLPQRELLDEDAVLHERPGARQHAI